MRSDSRHPLPARLHSLVTLAELLERLEATSSTPSTPSTASAAQYRDVARHVSALLAAAEPDEHLHRLLNAAPATALLYENLRYGVAGLVRSPLQQALSAELAASAAIATARRPKG